MWKWDAFAFACIGATAVQILHWLAVARSGKWPKHSTSIVQWLLTLGLILIAGALGVSFFYNRDFDPFFGIQTGASAPLIIEQLGAAGLPDAKRHLGEESVYEQFLGFFRY